MKAELRRAEMQQTDDGDWYIEYAEGEQVAGIDFTAVGRKPVVWIITGDKLP